MSDYITPYRQYLNFIFGLPQYEAENRSDIWDPEIWDDSGDIEENYDDAYYPEIDRLITLILAQS